MWKAFTKDNEDFFNDLGSPGGASKVGAQTFDGPLVAGLPQE